MSASEEYTLKSLVAHSFAVQGSLSLEVTSNLARKQKVDFIAVQEGTRVTGLCSAVKIGLRL
ncbi:MAG: hypothetical protein AAGH40_07705, partial [Verrucomicrobiota bacterium]